MPSSIEVLKSKIAETYFNNPYHNWPHGEYVWDAMTILEWKVWKWTIAGFWHDSDHKWFVQADDEERAAAIIYDILKKDWYDKDGASSVVEYIPGTIFKERGNLVIPEHKLIADADVSKLWWEYPEFIKSAVRFLLETADASDISDAAIQGFFKNDQPAFFKLLTDISRRPETPFLTQEAQKHFPNFSENKDILAQHIEENPQELIGIVREMEKEPEIQKWREKLREKL